MKVLKMPEDEQKRAWRRGKKARDHAMLRYAEHRSQQRHLRYLSKSRLPMLLVHHLTTSTQPATKSSELKFLGSFSVVPAAEPSIAI